MYAVLAINFQSRGRTPLPVLDGERVAAFLGRLDAAEGAHVSDVRWTNGDSPIDADEASVVSVVLRVQGTLLYNGFHYKLDVVNGKHPLAACLEPQCLVIHHAVDRATSLDEFAAWTRRLVALRDDVLYRRLGLPPEQVTSMVVSPVELKEKARNAQRPRNHAVAR